MSNNAIILIEYESGKVEWRPSTTETLSYIASWWGFIESIQEIEAGADAPTDDAAEKLKQAEDESTKVMVKQNTERLERLEAMVLENARQLSEIREDMAAVCQATNARCR